MIHWTQSILDRKRGWLDELVHARFREILLHVGTREGLFCPTYCLMDDHIHLLWMGLKRTTDQRRAMAFLRTHLEPLLAPAKFQPQAHDRVLRQFQREQDAFAKVYAYILNNPVRQGLVSRAEEWPYYGAVIPGYPRLDPLDSKFGPLLWQLYWAARDTDAGEFYRPLWKNG